MAVVVTVVVTVGVILSNSTQIIVGAFQRDQTQNSFEPRNPPRTSFVMMECGT